MIKVLFVLLILLLIKPTVSFALTASPTANPTNSMDKIDQIKDKVTSKVAKLKLVEKRGIVGTVDSVQGSEIKINDLNDNERIIDVDELTKFSSDNNPDFDISNIKKGTKISVIGLYNKDSDRLLARFINETSIPLFLNGVISDKDKDNFTITLSTEDEKKYTVDIENITKTFSFSDGQLQTYGFTKMSP
jgi:hypothetical protein